MDPDGRDDLFDDTGKYLEHIDNGTDFVKVQNANGKFQNITEFSYSENDVANREMLSNVATYYAHQVGLSQTLDICDVGREGAIAMTDIISDFHQVYMAVVNSKIDPIANTCSNIMNALVHEYDHVIKGIAGPVAEVSAIMKEMTHPTWSNTTEVYKYAALSYLFSNMKMALDDPKNFNTIKALVSPNMDIINRLGYKIEFVNNNFVVSYGIPDIEVTTHKK